MFCSPSALYSFVPHQLHTVLYLISNTISLNQQLHCVSPQFYIFSPLSYKVFFGLSATWCFYSNNHIVFCTPSATYFSVHHRLTGIYATTQKCSYPHPLYTVFHPSDRYCFPLSYIVFSTYQLYSVLTPSALYCFSPLRSILFSPQLHCNFNQSAT